MKLATPEQVQAHTAASRRGALEGLLAGGTVATLGSMYAHRRWAYYRSLPPSLKVLGVLIVAAPALSIQAERRGLEYDKSQWEGDGARLLEAQELHELTKWERMSTTDKIADWASRHEYSIIIGGWALSLVTAGAIINRNKFQTPAQKIVQARMWAQGLTIGIILTAAGFKTTHNKGESASRPPPDHSWMEVVEQHEQERREEERIKARIASAQRRGAPDVPT
ncbi:HIG1 domain-containing protein [Mycena sanguinolenta]|uniref:HIG1 domain-containing protein n=2 Tax=Mycena sanguinolenta TaxID=230812 RepID=A0A8H6YC81_9AGAR|nr:HIG1 domain-containing protein [Mycena sanguinolenta]